LKYIGSDDEVDVVGACDEGSIG